MSYKKFVGVFSSIPLLALASGAAWANDPIVATVKIPPGQPAPIIQDNGAASGNMRLDCTRVASSCTTGSLDAPLPQNNAIATRDAQIATAEIGLLSQNPAARSTQKLSLVSSGTGRASPLPANENSTDSTLVRTGIFGGAEEKVTTKRPVEQVQTGGFGSPQGFRGKAQGDSAGNVPKLGSFGLPDGPGVGNGTGGRHGVQGVVASAGFGSGVAGPGSGNGPGGGGSKVTVGEFGKVSQVAPAPAKAVPALAPVEFQPMEILFKPSPVYTEEARRLGIQGDVALSVVFQANGSIRVTGVVKSLGHGLDQEAEQVATQIRFKPAQRAGQPTDFPATLRVEFRLAGQSS
jgi:TonB family protein